MTNGLRGHNTDFFLTPAWAVSYLPLCTANVKTHGGLLRGIRSFSCWLGVMMRTEYVYLLIAIIAEVMATSSLKASQTFTRLLPSLAVIVGYGAAFYFLSLSLKGIGVGVAYALWSGIGIVLLSVVGVVVFGEKIDLPAVIGFALIVAGVIILNLYSNVVAH